jgi:hypothetical protein
MRLGLILQLLSLAPVTFDLMAGVLEFTGFLRIEFSFRSADIADQGVEVGRLFRVPDEGKHDFVDWHLDLLCAEHIRSGIVKRRIVKKRKDRCRLPLPPTC